METKDIVKDKKHFFASFPMESLEYNLLDQLLQVNLQKRILAQEALKHNYFSLTEEVLK